METCIFKVAAQPVRFSAWSCAFRLRPFGVAEGPSRCAALPTSCIFVDAVSPGQRLPLRLLKIRLSCKASLLFYSAAAWGRRVVLPCCVSCYWSN